MILQKAPSWSAEAYHNGEKVKISSADYEGKWYVLYWYPLDFTLICPTEIREFQRLQTAFEREGTAVIGCSTDSFYSHRAWLAETPTFFKPITHPVIADTSHEVTRAFGMLYEAKGIAFRGTVVVDDSGVVRAFAANDTTVGRNPSEVLRTVEALRAGGVCGVNWKKGDAFLG